MSIPLMLLQFYQNSQMARDNEEKLDKANLYAFVANICFFLIECTLHQALIPDQEWSVISKKRIGFYEIEDKGGATDNSDEIDEYVSSSEEDMSVTDAVSESNPSETGATDQNNKEKTTQLTFLVGPTRLLALLTSRSLRYHRTTCRTYS